MSYLNAFLSMGALGLAFGAALGFAAKKLAVKRDPRVDEIIAILPGANCGACGYPGCSGFAAGVVEGNAPVDGCPVGRSEVALAIAKIMGVECSGGPASKYARVLCIGDRTVAPDVFEYKGIQDCKAAQISGGGAKGCIYGCLGLGTCVRACQFDAMYMAPNGLPVVIDENCTGCGKCVEACPRRLIELRTLAESVNVMCRSHARGPEVKKVCKVGCIACSICVKACPEKAITMDDNVAVIDQSKCTRCGICVEKCPVKCIHDLAGPAVRSEAV